ncbi:MAG: L-serine ammonia-lyase [Streptosporangiales bacterium]|nr:L-serine ammonia-lyase [Streptosporangiales bacterium]
MTISVFELFKVGIGPSSSHTVGPMRAARTFVTGLRSDGLLPRVASVRVELFGSLGATGHGHGSDKAVLLGLSGEAPDLVDPRAAVDLVSETRESGRVRLAGEHEIAFDEDRDLVMHRRKSLPYHSNGMRFLARDAGGAELRTRTYYSVGGGFVVDEEAASDADRVKADDTPVRYPFRTAADLLGHCDLNALPVSEIMRANETSWRPEPDIREGLLGIWQVMRDCVAAGCAHEGTLPGGLKVPRRAPGVYRELSAEDEGRNEDPFGVMDWVGVYAMAVNEENASGGRVVTAPTNGAAGIIPAVLHYYDRFVPGSSSDGVVRFLLTAGAIGAVYAGTASISGAEVGCQGEVGVACSMAAAGLAEVLGGTPRQVENAAEIGMEHHLGLTCDPVGGLVQIPCIERNSMGAMKAIHAARIALRGDGNHIVALDKVIKTMRETGADMKLKYKETARGGLAVNVIEC